MALRTRRILQGFCMVFATCGTVLHVMRMWFNPKVPPLFFSCQAAVRRSDILVNFAVGAEQARCRAGTCSAEQALN